MGPKKVFFDFGRTNVVAAEMQRHFLSFFPQEAKWQAFGARNFLEANSPFPNDAPWIEPVRDIPIPSADEIKAVKDAAVKAKQGIDAIALVASGSAYNAVKAGIDFFMSSATSHSPEIIFLGCNDEKKYHENEMKKLAGKKFSVCIIDDGELPPYVKSAADEVTAKLKDDTRVYKFTNSVAFKKADAILAPGTLFILAVCGIDIDAVVKGAVLEPLPDTSTFIAQACGDAGICKDDFMPYLYVTVKHYSLVRQVMALHGNGAEIFTWADSRFGSFARWVADIFTQYEHTTGIKTNFCSFADSNTLSGNGEKQEPFMTVFYCNDYKSFSVNSNEDLNIAIKPVMDDYLTKQWLSKVPVLRIGISNIDANVYGNFIGLFSRAARISSLWK